LKKKKPTLAEGEVWK